jgi:NTE family protein
MATDICTGEPVVIKEGGLAEALMVTSCVPGIFSPCKRGERLLVDGGVVENVPVSPLKEMGAEVVLGVDLNGARTYDLPGNIIDVLLNAFDIAIDTTTRIQLEKADIVIELDLARYSRTDPRNIHELYAEGYRSGVIALKQIKKQLAEREPSAFEVLEKRFRAWRES